MHASFATQYTLGDSLLMLFLMVAIWIPPLVSALSALFSAIAWRRRKETGFLLLALGFGFSALLSFTIALITSSRGAGALSSYMLSVRFVGWIGPALILCGCWRLAAKNA